MNFLEKRYEDMNNPKKHVQVTSVKEYFDLPREKRTRWNFWYLKPQALPWDMFDEIDANGWRGWERRMQKEFPIQYFLREGCGDIYSNLFGQFGYVTSFKYWLRDLIWPCHQEIRKVIPRHWTDISHLIVDMNFALIKSFYHEAKNGWVDWNSDEAHKEFMDWLEKAYKYIIEERMDLEKQLSEAYPTYEERKTLSYEDAYKKVCELEDKIKNKDTEVITKMVEYREMFWT